MTTKFPQQLDLIKASETRINHTINQKPKCNTRTHSQIVQFKPSPTKLKSDEHSLSVHQIDSYIWS